MYNGIEQMRLGIKAPIDSWNHVNNVVSCKKKFSLEQSAYHKFVFALLFNNKDDEQCHLTLRYLIEQKNLSVNTILNTHHDELCSWISKVPFHERRACKIKYATIVLDK